ncbi:glycyl-tRNA synthetase [Fibrobacteres bacterium R8-0-B4]
MPEIAKKIDRVLRDHSRKPFSDHASSIGRRYARQDEAGTPFCITVDSQTLEDQTVTVRERDSREQYRVASDQIADVIGKKLREAMK